MPTFEVIQGCCARISSNIPVTAILEILNKYKSSRPIIKEQVLLTAGYCMVKRIEKKAEPATGLTREGKIVSISQVIYPWPLRMGIPHHKLIASCFKIPGDHHQTSLHSRVLITPDVQLSTIFHRTTPDRHPN